MTARIDYEGEIKRAVDEAETYLAERQRIFDLNQSQRPEQTNPQQDALDRAKEGVKAAKKRLAAFRKLDSTTMAARIAELRESASIEAIKARVDTVRGRLVQAALLKLEARLELRRMEGALRDNLREAQQLENELLGTVRVVDFYKQPGFSEFRIEMSPDDLLAELERLADSDEPTPLRSYLSRSADGRLIVGGYNAREIFQMVGV